MRKRQTQRREKRRGKNKRSSSTGIIAMFLLGLCIISYPVVSNMWNEKRQSKAIATYSEHVKSLDADRKAELFEQAKRYNERLLSANSPITEGQKKSSEYDAMLAIDDTEIMGYIEIPQIDIKLPIYHGTGEVAIAQGAGHLQGSSLPIGGKGTHCVLSSHRGLPKAKLFSDLDLLNVGDRFSITVLDRKNTYKVDHISIVEPEDLSNLKIQEGKDYCTLLTCTPYGINTQRLLVRGVRVHDSTMVVENEAHRVNTVYVAVLIAIPILLGVFVYGIVKDKRKNKEKRKNVRRNATNDKVKSERENISECVNLTGSETRRRRRRG